MNEFPAFEQKRISDEELIQALKTGVENLEVRQLLENWSKQQERSGVDFVSSVEINLRRGRVYISAGYIEEGLDELEAAFDEAWYAHDENLANKIRSEIDGLNL